MKKLCTKILASALVIVLSITTISTTQALSSHSSNSSVSTSAGVGIIGSTTSQGWSTSTGGSTSTSTSTSYGTTTSESWGTSTSNSISASNSSTEGISHSTSNTTSHSTSTGVSIGITGSTTSQGWSTSTGGSTTTSQGTSASHSVSNSTNSSHSSTEGVSHSTSNTTSTNSSTGIGIIIGGWTSSTGGSTTNTQGTSTSHSISNSTSDTHSSTDSIGHSTSNTTSHSTSTGVSIGITGSTTTDSWSSSNGGSITTSQGTSASHTVSNSTNSSHSSTEGISNSTNNSTSNSSTGVGIITGSTQGWNETHSTSNSISDWLSNGDVSYGLSISGGPSFAGSEMYGKKINLKTKKAITNNLDGYSSSSKTVINKVRNEIHSNYNKEKVQIITSKLTCENIRSIISYYIAYFGNDTEIDNVISFKNSILTTIITVDMSQYRKLEADRNYIYGRIDQVLSNMEDGSDKFITYQISNYIADLIAYTAGHRDVMDAIDGKGVCATYAFLYKIMAERVGIRTDIIYGTAYETDAGYTTKSDGAKSKVGHAWNKSLINGKYYYYDITWFDGKNALDYNYFYQPKPIHTTTFAVYVKDAISYHHYGVTIPTGC